MTGLHVLFYKICSNNTQKLLRSEMKSTVTSTCKSQQVCFIQLRLLWSSVLIGITHYFKMHDVKVQRVRLCVRTCLCV
jgi:hypothetical protein